jgi:hypothetical protein
LDYLIKVKGMTFPEAVIQIDGQVVTKPPVPQKSKTVVEQKKLLLQTKSKSN